MVRFNDLSISDDGKYLYIDVSVKSASYFEDVHIDSITIMTGDKVSENAPEIPTENYIYKETVDGEEKNYNWVLTTADFIKKWETDAKAMNFKQSDMSNTIFFIYIKCKGTPAANIPCNMDKEYTVGVTFDVRAIYQKAMNYTKELANCCDIPSKFIDFILLWNALKASVATSHYLSAVKYYNLLSGSADSSSCLNYANNTCGCHG